MAAELTLIKRCLDGRCARCLDDRDCSFDQVPFIKIVQHRTNTEQLLHLNNFSPFFSSAHNSHFSDLAPLPELVPQEQEMMTSIEENKM